MLHKQIDISKKFSRDLAYRSILLLEIIFLFNIYFIIEISISAIIIELVIGLIIEFPPPTVIDIITKRENTLVGVSVIQHIKLISCRNYFFRAYVKNCHWNKIILLDHVLTFIFIE